MTLTYRGWGQNSFGPDQHLYLWADDGDLAIRFAIPHSVFVKEFNSHPTDQPTDRFQELLATVQAACAWAYEREKHTLKFDDSASVEVTQNDFRKAKKWLAAGMQRKD